MRLCRFQMVYNRSSCNCGCPSFTKGCLNNLSANEEAHAGALATTGLFTRPCLRTGPPPAPTLHSLWSSCM